MNLQHHYKTRFQNDLTGCGVTEGALVIAACSGGVDSMCLVNAMLKVGARFEVAHVNFKLRGEDSEADSASVVAWCDENGVVCHVRHLPAGEEAEQKGNGIQEAARRLRYAWFEQLREERGGSFIAVAHHLKDQTETLLINLLRGVSPSSLGAMAPRNVNTVRPFLSWSQEEIEEWVKLDKVPFREDLSNNSTKYLRNRIRNEVLPLLESIRPGAISHLAEWTNRLRSQAVAVEISMSDASRDIVKYCDFSSNTSANDQANDQANEICRIDLKLLGESAWGDRVLDKLLAERKWPLGSREQAHLLKRASIGAEVVFEDDSLVREREYMILRKFEVENEMNESNSACTLNTENGTFKNLSWTCEIEGLDLSPPRSPEILWLDFHALEHPLIWRTWENGDKLDPSGMEGSVNISDLLTQWKVPHLSRSSARVLQDAKGNILWVFVAGEEGVWSRISRKVTIAKSTKRLVLEVKI
jgi:tRNA(Ile)-lysidine synthase